MNEIAFPAFASVLSDKIASKKGRLSCPFTIEKRILDRIASENLTLKYLGYAEPYKGMMTKIAFECLECGEVWNKSTVNNFLAVKTKCPCHRKKACLAGLKKRKGKVSAKKRLPPVPTFYIMKFREPINGQEIGKIGYSKNPDKRRYHLNCSNKRKLDIVYTHRFENGYGATGLENYIKKEMKTGVVSPDVVPEGFSETFIYTSENVKRIKSLTNLYFG
ncbi:TPA: GIY-YIG nuclease family protein [Proteus mirabilis]|nr:GIY-YIG nuclease family protein [Proteus mirabilis]